MKSGWMLATIISTRNSPAYFGWIPLFGRHPPMDIYPETRHVHRGCRHTFVMPVLIIRLLNPSLAGIRNQASLF